MGKLHKLKKEILKNPEYWVTTHTYCLDTIACKSHWACGAYFNKQTNKWDKIGNYQGRNPFSYKRFVRKILRENTNIKPK